MDGTSSTRIKHFQTKNAPNVVWRPGSARTSWGSLQHSPRPHIAALKLLAPCARSSAPTAPRSPHAFGVRRQRSGKQSVSVLLFPHSNTVPMVLAAHWAITYTAPSFGRKYRQFSFLLYFVNQFHIFMLISTHTSLLHFLQPSPLHSFTLNSKVTFLGHPFRHRSLPIGTPD